MPENVRVSFGERSGDISVTFLASPQSDIYLRHKRIKEDVEKLELSSEKLAMIVALCNKRLRQIIYAADEVRESVEELEELSVSQDGKKRRHLFHRQAGK